MRQILERELKLDPPAGFALHDLLPGRKLPGRELDARLFTSTYHDTPTRSLAHAGITLRRRVENGLSHWQLKLPREDGRAELEAGGGPAGPPPELAALLVAHLRHGPLEPVATLRTRRRGIRVVEGARTIADVTLDSVDVLEGARSESHFDELEIELVDGAAKDLDRLARALRDAGAKRSDGIAKVLRVLDLEPYARPDGNASLLEQFRYLLLRQLAQLEMHDPGVRLGDDPEDLHRFRVATRRSRALIRASRGLIGEQLAALEAELRWLGGVLGPVRDLDVLLARLRAAAPALGDDAPGVERIVAALDEERAAASDALREGLASPRYLELLERFETDARTLPSPDAPGGAGAIAKRELRRLRKAYATLGSKPSDASLHAARIRVKRARYAAELAAPSEGKRAVKLVAALKELQDVIGAHQDAVVAEERVRAAATPESALAAGRLVERERAERIAARAAVPGAWKRVARAGDGAFA